MAPCRRSLICLVLLLLPAGVGTRVAPLAPPYTLRALPATVHVGETYAVWFEATIGGQSLHNVVLDGMDALTDGHAGRGSCPNSATPCRFWRPYTATQVGQRTHVVNGSQVNGQPWGQVSLTVDVRPEPGYAEGWEVNNTISPDARVYQGIAASNGVVLVTDSDSESNTTRLKRSTDAGITFGPWVPLPGSGTSYIEQPIAIDGSLAVGLGVDAKHTITDFCCPRHVGPMVIWRSTDRGATWSRQEISPLAKGLRLSVAVEGSTVHATWTDYRRGVWDIYYARSADAGLTWTEQVIAFGTNTVGAERPSIAVAGSTVWLAWMDARDGQGPCAIEGGATLPVCTEVYVAKSSDSGSSFSVSRLTDTAGYAGRPEIDLNGERVTVAFDFRPFELALPNQVHITTSDDGVLWTPPQPLSPSGAEQTHALLASVGSVTQAVWMDARTGRYEIRERLSAGTDGRLTSGSSVASLASDDAYVYAVSRVGSAVRVVRKLVRGGSSSPPRSAPPRTLPPRLAHPRESNVRTR